MRKKSALLSVYNKDGIDTFASELIGLGWQIIASGGTAKYLTEKGIKVTNVTDLVGKPILGHRVVTLSREIHAGLLAEETEEHLKELEQEKISFIDLVCCDLYPLEEEIKNPNATRKSVIEKTDIGGPTMISSAAKGRRIVVCDPNDRTRVIEWLKNGEESKEEFVNELAAKADYVVSKYRLLSAEYHGNGMYTGLIGKQVEVCKYGENAYQAPAGLFSNEMPDPLALSSFEIVAGTAPSYNNWCDLDRLLQTLTHIAAGFEQNWGRVPYISIGVKHGNPCGTGVGINKKEVLQKMIEGDPLSIFGGLVILNFPLDEVLAEVLLSHKVESGRRILDGIVAPDFTPKAIEQLSRKGDKCRFIKNKALENLGKTSLDPTPRIRFVRGGFLRQPNYTFIPDFKKAERYGFITPQHERDLILAWAIGSTSNSNTITIVKNGKLLGNGVGQQDRVGAAELALTRARRSGHDLDDASAYSDSFFPFPDGPQKLIDAGIKVIFATSGSVKDKEIIQTCNSQGVSILMIPDAEARGFFGH